MTNEEFLKLDTQFEKYMGTLCLTNVYDSVLLYTGTYCTDEDYLYSFLSKEGEVNISICCCNIIWLWEELIPNSYNSLVKSWNLNNTVQARYNRIVNINITDFSKIITSN